MSSFPWQVVTHWLNPGGSEYVHTAAFATLGEARDEARRLSPCLGALVNGKVLRSVQLLGDTRELLDQPGDTFSGCEPRAEGTC